MRERWKAAREGDEIVSETVCLQRARAGVIHWGILKLNFDSLVYNVGDGIPIEEWACECVCVASLSPYGAEA